ncbi:MAG: hypothetical protein IMZ65_00405 [Planctomycetes bacterium]|nr:hypothetical protein [Planctomycetota bacterium]
MRMLMLPLPPAGEADEPGAEQGREKVSQLVTSFLKTDPTARPWYVKQ